ncbi:EF-hand calcium-binding domain-containing protein 4B [Hemitrygon akajei]|uniref:EF-hand calcium-binding domain-containing protein 4B n=1 Tax=Hemitrygon akajei TaxID=2704970 RepID=UPI003BF98564
MAAFGKVPLGETTIEDEDSVSAVDWKRAEVDLTKKAQEFFLICDRECKGFINQRDLEYLQAEVSLSAEQLKDVFDALDTDGNGKLTLEEFTTGFSQFLLKEKIFVSKVNSVQDQNEGLNWDPSEKRLMMMDNDEEHCFQMLIDNLGAKNLFKGQEEVQILWLQLRKDEPQLLSNFEALLGKISIQIQEANKEKEMMEFALKRKETEYFGEIKHLYDETEQQIQREKERIFDKGMDLKSRCQELEEVLRVKEQEQEQLSQSHKRLEREFGELVSEKQECKMENQRLKRTTEELEKSLQKANNDLLDAQLQIQVLQQRSSQLQEEQEMEIYRVTESMEREKLSLCKQLDFLREMNKHLRDEQDMSNLKKPFKYGSGKQRAVCAAGQCVENKLCSDRQDIGNSKLSLNNLWQANRLSHIGKGMEKESPPAERRYLQRIISIEEDPLPYLLETHSATPLHNWVELKEEEGHEEQSQDVAEAPSPLSSQTVRPAPLGQDREIFSNPDRLFKIILVGNSSVGKSSVLRRFCGDGFYPGICATVGIDYCVRTVNVDDSLLALQLWDTAGQERFHSITKQFLRKVDGVVLVYDITAAASFIAVQNWMQSVQEEAGPEVLILLLANKTDLESERRVSTKEGQQVAMESNMIFYECSAFTGANITEAIMHLARLLKELEDKEKEKFVELGINSPQQKSCCSK